MRHPWRRELVALKLALAVGLVGLSALFLRRPAAEPREEDEVAASIEDYFDWLHEGRLGPSGAGGRLIAQGSLLNAFEEISNMPRGAADVRPGVWVPLGPSPLLAGSTPWSGRTPAIAVDPTNPDVVYIGAALGGVWKSSDRGVSWTPLTDNQPSLAMGSIAIDPTQTNVIYAGTGEQDFSGDSYYGAGVLRSLDGGATWTRLGEAEFVLPTGGGATISRVLVDPINPQYVYVASNFGLFKSADYGDTWTLKLSARGQATVHDLVLDPSNPQTVYASLGLPSASTNKGVHKSTDGGDSWTRLDIGLADANIGRINLAIAPSNPLTLYAAVGNPGGSPPIFRLKTSDGGQSWTRLPDCTGGGCGQASYNLTVAVDPQNPDIVYQGAVSLFRSINGGASWSSVSGTHGDHHALFFDQLGNLYIGDDGGVFRRNPAGQTASLNAGLNNTQFYAGVALHPSNPADVQGGSQDNGSGKVSSGLTWRRVCGGDGAYQAIDGADGDPDHVWYCSSQNLGIRKSLDGVTTIGATTGLDRTGAGFVAPYVMDPNNSRVLIAGTRFVWRTENGASNWFVNSPQLTTGNIRSLAFARMDSATTYYAGTTNPAITKIPGAVWRTTDAGATWTNVSDGLPTGRVVYHISVHPLNSNIVYVELSGFGTSGHLFRSADRGDTWQDISSNLPNLPTPALLVDGYSADPPILYVGTDLGIFRSLDDGVSWHRFSDGLPNTRVEDLVLNPATGVLVASTHGRGMWRLRQLNGGQ